MTTPIRAADPYALSAARADTRYTPRESAWRASEAETQDRHGDDRRAAEEEQDVGGVAVVGLQEDDRKQQRAIPGE